MEFSEREVNQVRKMFQGVPVKVEFGLIWIGKGQVRVMAEDGYYTIQAYLPLEGDDPWPTCDWQTVGNCYSLAELCRTVRTVLLFISD